ncbi:MAG: tRNA (guanosine(37)-N1)-methyltransferase TrmD [Patescibacteria group bacterium]|nr:tRNA (guanosine(37)-N1)-methyltransferase TrmD [Patescibacteria group bacterium]
MKIDIITIFPNQVNCFVSEGIFRIAQTKGVSIRVHDLRKWTTDKHRTVDDKPYGGGAGMVMMIKPIDKAVSELRNPKTYVVLTSPRGKRLNQKFTETLIKKEHIIIICGHYEGVDYRVVENIADKAVSIGDYVLSGGELPALVITDAVLRHVPGVLGNPKSLKEESFSGDMKLEYPQYTRPENYKGWKVPKVLLSGNHGKITKWRNQSSST